MTVGDILALVGMCLRALGSNSSDSFHVKPGEGDMA